MRIQTENNIAHTNYIPSSSPTYDGERRAELGGVGLIRARGEIQQLRYGERQEVGEQRRGLRRGLTSGVLLKRVSGAQLTTVATARQRATLASRACSLRYYYQK